jgi:hypothetical protein
VSGKDATGVALGAFVGGLVGAFNPAGLVGIGPKTAAEAAFNTGVTSAAGQGVNFARGGHVSGTAIAAAVGVRGAIAIAFGVASPAGLGATLGYQAAMGAISGLIGGAAKVSGAP